MQCPKRTRRSRLLARPATGAFLAARRSAAAHEDRPGGNARSQKGDLLFLSEDSEGRVIKPSDLTLGGQPIHAWPKHRKTSVIGKGSRLNEILVVKLDPGEPDNETRSRSANAIVAYSAVCSHAGCPVSGWLKAEQSDKDVLKCFCHNAEFNPRESAQVVFGFAPRGLAALFKADHRRLPDDRWNFCRKGR
jgi:rieske iron-sulfur protein